MKQKNLIISIILSSIFAITVCGGGSGSSTPAKSWGELELVETYNAGNASSPQIAFDSSRNAFYAVWSQDDGILSNIVANTYTSGNGWGYCRTA